MASPTDPSDSASGIPLKYKIGVPLAIVFLSLCAVGIAFLAVRYGQNSVGVIKSTGGSTMYQATTAKNEQTTGAPKNKQTTGAPKKGQTTGAAKNKQTTGAPKKGQTTGAAKNKKTTGAPKNGQTTGAAKNKETTGAAKNKKTTGAPKNGQTTGAAKNKQTTVAANSEPSDCGTVMSMKSRQNLLHWHNKYRSIAAKGEYEITTEKGKFRKLPPAKKMYQLKYNCSLEKSSLKWANTVQCEMKHSDYPVGENLFATTGKVTQEEAADMATKPLADEIAEYGMSALNEYRDEIGHATQVLWAETLTMGCGIEQCSNGWTMVVCQYYPP
ncbi:SCP-like protein [Necator americanus]|nr:SCP-like protein [Necator americanus]ETN68351.1 SCP-like protein [Necator americanus]